MAEENNHSLEMQIIADFGIAATSATTFEEKMKSIDEVVKQLSDKITTVRNSGNDLEKGVASSIDDIYKKLSSKAMTLDGKDIRKGIEKRLAEAIGDQGILFSNLTDGGPIDVKLTEDVSKKLRTAMGTELAKLADKLDIQGMNKGKLVIPVNDESVQGIQKKFNDVLKKAVSDNIKFVMENDEALDTFHVNTSNMNNLLQQVKKKFFAILNDPNFVRLDTKEVRPIVVSSKELDEALDNIRKSIGSIDAQFGTDITKQLQDLPNIKNKINAFQKHTAALFTELQQTIDAIDQMNPEEKNYKELKREAGRMKSKLINSGTIIISDITRQFDEIMKSGGANGEIGKEALANLDGIKSHLNTYIKGMADSAYNVITEELNLVKKSKDGKEFFAPSIQKLQQGIVDASKEALKNLSAGDMKIDTAAVKSVFDNWATQTSQQLMANSFATLSDLQGDLIASNKKVMTAYVKSLKKLATLEFTPTNTTGDKITVDIDEAKIKKEIQAKMREIANQLSSNVDFTPGAKNSLDAGLTLTKKQVDSIQTEVANILQSQLGRLGEQLGNRVGKDFDSSLLEKFDKQVFNEAKNLVTTMVDQANNISKAITSGMDSSGFKALTTDEQNQIKDRFKDAGSKMVNDFSSMMDNALSSFMITSSITEEVKNKLQGKIESLVKNTNITFEDSKTPLVLQGLVADVQRELQTAIKMNVEAWTPDLVAFNPDINFKSVFDNINKAINTQLKRASDDIIKMVNEQSSPLNTKKDRPFIDAEARGKGDMSVYARNKLKGNDLKRLEEQGFKYLEKSEKGHEYSLQDSSKLTDVFPMLMVELNEKFKQQAEKQAAKLRQENIEVSKQKIVSVLSPIRDGVTSYLTLYAQAVGDVISDIKPNVSNKNILNNLNKSMAGMVDSAVASVNEVITDMSDAMRNINGPNKHKNAMKFVGLHATTSKNYESIKKEGFRILSGEEDEDNYRQYTDNIFGNKGLYTATGKQWFDGGIGRMPDYDKVLGVEALLDNPFVVKSDKDIRDFVDKHGKDLKRWGYSDDEYDLSSYVDDELRDKLKKLGHDALIIDFDEKLDKALKEKYNLNREYDGSPQREKDYTDYENALRENDIYHANRLGSQAFIFDPSKVKVIDEVDRTKDPESILKDLNRKSTIDIPKGIEPVINTKDLHADVRKLFAQQYDTTVAEWSKKYPRMEGNEQLGQVMQQNVQAIMNKFHDTITKQTKEAITLYGEELGKINANPRTESVNYFAVAMNKIQEAFEQKIQQWVNNQVGAITGFIQNQNFKLSSIGANPQDLVPIAATSMGRNPINYGSGLPFPDFGGGGGGQQSTGFNREPGNSEWFNGIQEKFDADWNNINEWVNQRLLDGLNTKNAIKGKVPKELEDHLFDYIDNHYTDEVKRIGREPFNPEDQVASKRIKNEMIAIVQDLKLAASSVKGVQTDGRILTGNESMDIQKEGLRYQMNRFQSNGYVPQERIDSVMSDIDSAAEANDLKKIRFELQKLRDLQTEIKKDQERERKQGNLLAQNEMLKGNNALQAESLQSLLKTVPVLQRYNVEQLKINNSTNTWSARLKDASGNIRSLQGTVDRATGSLYQHSEAISSVISQSARLASMNGPRYGNGNFSNNYYGDGFNNGSGGGKDYNPNGDFSSSVFNTMRYMTAGAVMGVPSMMLYRAWESNKEFDYQMERARQNFVIKGDLDPSKRMGDVALTRTLEQNPGMDVSSGEGAEMLEAERQKLLALSGQVGDDSKTIIENMAIKYRVDIEKAAQAFHISSRLLDDPNEAFAMSSAIVKANSIEEMDIETGTKGMEAIKSQWGIKGNDYEEVINMMIMAANRTPATVEDLLATQQRSGSIFREALPGMNKRDAISTSIGLSAMFNQATARSGKEGGTFFKTILQSPFSEKGSKALREYSIQNGFEDLDPYNKDGSQKNFVDVFASIMEHSLKLSPEQKRGLWASIFPQWHQGSAGAIETFMSEMVTDMQTNMEQVMATSGSAADLDQDGEISVREAFQDYFDKIKLVQPEAIDEMVDGNAQTWNQQMQLLITTFQATMRGVFDDLKDEFGLISSYLMSYMRAVRENTEAVSAVIGIGTKLAVGVGARYAVNKVADYVKDSNQSHRTRKFEEVGGYLFEERRAHNLNRIAVGEQLSLQGGKRQKIHGRREEVVNQLNLNDLNLANLRGDRDLSKNARSNMIDIQNRTGEDHSSAIRDLDQEINRLNRDINKLEDSSAQLDSELEKLKLEEKAVDDATSKLNQELKEQDRNMRSVNNRIDALADAMDTVGVDSQQLRSQVEKLNKEFTEGTTDATQYEARIGELGREAGLSDDALGKLRTEVNKLNRDFEAGIIKADQYAKKIKELETAHKLGSNGISSGGVAGAGTMAQSGNGLMNTIIAGSMLTGGLSATRGVFGRLKDMRNTGSVRSLFGKGGAVKNSQGQVLYEQNRDGTTSDRPIYTDVSYGENRARSTQTPDKWYNRGIFGSIGGVAKKAKNIRGVSTLAKLGRGFGAPLVLGDLAMNAWDAGSAIFQEDYEKQQIQATKLDNLNQKVQKWKYGNFGEKAMSSVSLLGDLTFGGINNLLGGNEASTGQVWDAMSTKASSEDELEKKLDEKFKTKEMRAEAKKLEDEYRERTDPDYDPLGESLDDVAEEVDAAQEAMEALESALSTLNNTMNRQLSMNEAQYTIDSTKLLLNGEKADSDQMRGLMKNLIEKNNATLENTLSELRTKMSNVSDKESDTYKDMQLQEKQLESQIVDNQYKIKQNNLSEYDAIMNRLQESLDATEDEYGIQESQAKIGGAKEDSPVLKKIESAKVGNSNALIEKAQTDLNNLVAKLGLKETDADYMKIQGAIRDLEKQQLDNLVAIKSNLDKSKGSFNLPSGIEVKDYMSHAMSKNTHKNVTTRMGDTVVNVTIDNMTGNQKDIQKMTDSLADAVKKANQQANSNFNKQVWSGMGANYTSPY